MGKALYRKYRPKTLSDVVGQKHITDTLEHSIANDRISHAYLFTGPRGVGKTSVARILAHQINELPYSDESNHLDIIEIDAASNNGVEDVRSLREKVAIVPTSAKYKVYIIDEVHMLSKPAFNALLKTLEEPPKHVIFILATTETHKLPDTIISRTQRFGFKPVSTEEVALQLRSIAAEEHIDIDDDALKLIAQHGEGSFRDSISLLDQIGNSDSKITVSTVENTIGRVPDSTLSDIIESIANGNLINISNALKTLKQHGAQAGQVSKQLSDRLRRDLLAGDQLLAPHQTLALLESLLTVPASQDLDTALELALYGSVLAAQTPASVAAPVPAPQATEANSGRSTSQTQKQDQPQPVQPAIEVVKVAVPQTPGLESEPESKPRSKPKPKTKSGDKPQESPHSDSPTSPEEQPKSQGSSDQSENSADVMSSEQWQEVINSLKGNHNTLYGITRMAVPEFKPGAIDLNFAFAFHKKRLSEEKTKHLLDQIIQKVTGRSFTINALHTKTKPSQGESEIAESTSNTPSDEPNLDIKNISNIFGDAEIVQ